MASDTIINIRIDTKTKTAFTNAVSKLGTTKTKFLLNKINELICMDNTFHN